MLVIGILVLLLYSSYNSIHWDELKNIYRISGIIVLYTIILLYNSTDIIYMGKSLVLFNDLLVITPYSVYIKILLLVITILYIISKNEYMKLNNCYGDAGKYSLNYSDYIIIILFNVLGMCIFIESYNTILIYIAIELQSYSLYIITSRYNNSYYSSKSGLIYFLLGSLASIIILIGLVILYSVTGLTNLYDISIYLNTIDQINSIGIDYKVILGYLLILIGLLFKIGVAPFHNWIINIYVNVPTIVTLWISLVTKISILTFIYNILHNTPFLFNMIGAEYNTGISSLNIIYILSILSVLCMCIGGIGGVSQIGIKRVIAYSGLANTGYMLYTIIANNQLTLQAYIFNISQYSLTHINWFLILLITIIYKAIYNNISYNKDSNITLNNGNSNYLAKLNDIFGYIVMNPYMSFSYIVTLASLIGIPPLLGFYGKYYMIISGIYSGYLFSSIVLIFVSGITTYYYSYILNILTLNLFNKGNNATTGFANIVKLYSSQYNNVKNQVVILSYLICYTISIITFATLFPLLLLDIYTNGSIILDFYQYTI